MKTPLIAVPAAHVEAGAVAGWRPGAFAVAETYVAAVRRAGGRPLLLPTPGDAPVEEILEPFDGLLLAGGGDLDPRRYGAPAHPAVMDVEPDRDALELDLVRAAHALRIPVLGICRGMQAINVAFGGTLHQHLPDVVGHAGHGDPVGGGAVEHTPWVRPDSRLAAMCGSAPFTCIARHHQAVDVVGDGLVVSAWTEDGVIEGVEREDAWVVGVQWHPEVTAGEDASQQALFDEFVAQAVARRLAPRHAAVA